MRLKTAGHNEFVFNAYRLIPRACLSSLLKKNIGEFNPTR